MRAASVSFSRSVSGTATRPDAPYPTKSIVVSLGACSANMRRLEPSSSIQPVRFGLSTRTHSLTELDSLRVREDRTAGLFSLSLSFSRSARACMNRKKPASSRIQGSSALTATTRSGVTVTSVLSYVKVELSSSVSEKPGKGEPTGKLETAPSPSSSRASRRVTAPSDATAKAPTPPRTSSVKSRAAPTIAHASATRLGCPPDASRLRDGLFPPDSHSY